MHMIRTTRRPRFLITMFVMVAAGSSLALWSSNGAAGQADGDEGQVAFLENGCARCHSIETQDIEATITLEAMRGPDLGQIGTARDADWIVAYVKREETQDGDRHRAPYGGTDEDLRLLSEWLVQRQ